METPEGLQVPDPEPISKVEWEMIQNRTHRLKKYAKTKKEKQAAKDLERLIFFCMNLGQKNVFLGQLAQELALEIQTFEARNQERIITPAEAVKEGIIV